MNYLQKRIVEDGRVLPNNVLRIDSFLNHQIDPVLIRQIVDEFYEHFKDKPITKIFTIEASGIAPAMLLAENFGVEMLFAKKSLPATINLADKYSTLVHSYTKGTTSEVIISQEYLIEDDVVLIVDDFLANGEAALGLVDLVRQAGAEVAGIAICVEKSFQPGRKRLEELGLDVYSICRIKSLENGRVEFEEGH